ncbi:hypothetical protein [Xylanimonas protaetiae]|uniref:Uncharacterized protein n=1 Tax=Xylanimonas protaetiae TaxID=2509457 RepID=A0A4P6F005_9MICO|nr:hypothetical protein [Xylanimonas protaetiae]QAY68772.1 hypothetical protein ET471_00845 [Xylanimonas protaetiae]
MSEIQPAPGEKSGPPPHPMPAREPAVTTPDPMAVHRDPSRKPSATGATLASRARVRGDYQWVRLADLSLAAGQSVVGRGISLELALARRVNRLPVDAVNAMRSGATDRAERTPSAPLGLSTSSTRMEPAPGVSL